MSYIAINWIGTLVLLGGLLHISYIDWQTYRLPNIWTKSLIILGLLYNYHIAEDLYPFLLGAVFGYAVFWVIETVYRLVRKREGLGRGDAKLLAAGGVWCGALALPFIILIASSAGLIYILIQPQDTRANMKLPFGPFLAVAIAITFLSLKFI